VTEGAGEGDRVFGEGELRAEFDAVMARLDGLSPDEARALHDEAVRAEADVVTAQYVAGWSAMFRRSAQLCEQRLEALPLRPCPPDELRDRIARRAGLRSALAVWRTAADILDAGEWRDG
jgi:hypothetical protein